MFIIIKLKLINKYKFVKIIIDKNSKPFVVYIIALNVLAGMTNHLFELNKSYKK